MRYRVLKEASLDSSRVVHPGEELELTPAFARFLVARGYLEPITAPTATLGSSAAGGDRGPRDQVAREGQDVVHTGQSVTLIPATNTDHRADRPRSARKG